MAQRNSPGRWLAMTALALVAIAGLLWAWGSAEMNQPSLAPAGTRITVRAGASLRGVLTQLADVKALKHPRLVEGYLRLHGERLSAKAGNYLLPVGGSLRQILGQLQGGQVVLEQITIVEGWTFAQMRQAINASTALTHEWRALDDAALLAALGEHAASAEGRFYPDSYRFAAGTPDRKIYEMAFERMHERLDAEWAQRAPGLPLATKYSEGSAAGWSAACTDAPPGSAMGVGVRPMCR